MLTSYHKKLMGVTHMMALAFNVWRKVKEKLRRGRRPLWQLGSMFIAAAAASLALMAALSGIVAAAPSEMPKAGSRSVIATLSDTEAKVTVKLRRVYLCGAESETIGELHSAEALGMLKEHPEWTAELDEDGAVVMEQRIADLSESCKRNAYFGVDKQGRLSLFDGAPKKEKVLKTFFQLDVRYMESSLPKDRIEELARGIRVNDVDEFNSVLSTYSDYAAARTEKVMKRTY